MPGASLPRRRLCWRTCSLLSCLDASADAPALDADDVCLQGCCSTRDSQCQDLRCNQLCTQGLEDVQLGGLLSRLDISSDAAALVADKLCLQAR